MPEKGQGGREQRRSRFAELGENIAVRHKPLVAGVQQRSQ